MTSAVAMQPVQPTKQGSLRLLDCQGGAGDSGGNQESVKQPMPTPTPEYFEQLIKDRSQLRRLTQGSFHHLDRLLEHEIGRVRDQITQINLQSEDVDLPEPEGEVIVLSEKMYAPVEKFPQYNFAGRLLGPRGMTVKQLEQKTGCRILVRGRGFKSRSGQENNNGEDLHVTIIAEDTAARARIKLNRAVKEVETLMNPSTEGMDDLKKKQLVELAIINGTYRPPVHTRPLSTNVHATNGPHMRFSPFASHQVATSSAVAPVQQTQAAQVPVMPPEAMYMQAQVMGASGQQYVLAHIPQPQQGPALQAGYQVIPVYSQFPQDARFATGSVPAFQPSSYAYAATTPTTALMTGGSAIMSGSATAAGGYGSICSSANSTGDQGEMKPHILDALAIAGGQ